MAAIFNDNFFLKIGLITEHRCSEGQKFRRNRSISYGFQNTGIFMFCNFCKKFENSKRPPVLARQTFFDTWVNYSAEILYGQKLCRNCCISQGFQDTSIFVFCNFREKFENSKWPPFLARQIFLKIGLTILQSLWVKNFVKITLALMFFEIQAFLRKNLKIQNGHHFWIDKL